LKHTALDRLQVRLNVILLDISIRFWQLCSLQMRSVYHSFLIFSRPIMSCIQFYGRVDHHTAAPSVYNMPLYLSRFYTNWIMRLDDDVNNLVGVLRTYGVNYGITGHTTSSNFIRRALPQ